MKSKLRGRIAPLCVALGILVALPAVALADNVQVNDLDTNNNASKEPGQSGTASVRIVGNNSPNGDVSGCNVDASNPATVGFNVSQPSKLSLASSSVQVTDCGNPGAKSVGYQVSPSAQAGDVITVSTSTTGGKAGSKYNEDTFTVTVIAPAAPADTTAPSIAINTPADGAAYTLNQSVLADYSCQDEAGGSGVASCAGPVSDGAAIDTGSVGSKSFTVNAADNAGNQSSLTHDYSVVYDFAGFFRPVDNPQTLNVARAGSAIPVKFSLNGDQGLNIFAAGSPASQKVSCDTSASTDPVEETVTAGSSSLSYDATVDQYNYVWKTEKSWAGTCRQLTVKLDDGTMHRANFKLNK